MPSALQGADQTPLSWTTPLTSLEMAVQPVGFSQRANPEQTTDTSGINQQVQSLLKHFSQFGSPFKRENVSA